MTSPGYLFSVRATLDRRAALFSRAVARQLAGRFRTVADDATLRDCIDQATAGVLDTWQLDTLTDWTRAEIARAGKEA